MLISRILPLAICIGLANGAQAQRDLRVSFEIQMDTSWEWTGGSITIATDDARENKRFGKFTQTLPLGFPPEYVIKARLPHNRFYGRSVRISFYSAYGDCLYMPTISGILLADRSQTTIAIQRDEDCWKNRTTEVSTFAVFPCKLFSSGSDTTCVITAGSRFQARLLGMDRSDSAFIAFSIDTACKVIDRKVVQQFTHLCDDVPDAVFDGIEHALRKRFNTCKVVRDFTIPVRYSVP